MASMQRMHCMLRPLPSWQAQCRWTTLRCYSIAADKPHVTIVGGGAAGLTAAFFAAEAGARVTVLERNKEAGKKILMSGGTRCNVLPLEADLQQDFFSDSSSSAVRAVFATWPLDACRAWLEDPYSGVGVELQEEEETAKLFPVSNSSKEVRDRLVAACLDRGVDIKYGASIERLEPASPLPSPEAQSTHQHQPPADASSAAQAQHAPQHDAASESSHEHNNGHGQAGSARKGKKGKGGGGTKKPSVPSPGWICNLSNGTSHRTDRLVLATGGLSFPAVGTDGTGHRILRELGVPLVTPYPALTPLTGQHPGGTQLAGLSLYNVDLGAALPGVKKLKKANRTGLLFTHKGYSGPAVLDLSHHAVKALVQGGPRPVLKINWTADAPDIWEARLKAGGTALVSTVLQRNGLRERLADAICEELQIVSRRMCELRKEERAALITMLTAYELRYTGHEGYKKAEVTGGGVALENMDVRTLECKSLPGVHIAGELLDVFGRIGGFNFYWAWVSGRLAGRAAALAGFKDVEARTEKIQEGNSGKVLAPA